MRIGFMVLPMLAFNVMVTWTGIIRYESPRDVAITYFPEFRVAPTLSILIALRGVELTDVIVQLWDSDPSFQIVRNVYLKAR
jgi:hypothetical protein